MNPSVRPAHSHHTINHYKRVGVAATAMPSSRVRAFSAATREYCMCNPHYLKCGCSLMALVGPVVVSVCFFLLCACSVPKVKTTIDNVDLTNTPCHVQPHTSTRTRIQCDTIQTSNGPRNSRHELTKICEHTARSHSPSALSRVFFVRDARPFDSCVCRVKNHRHNIVYV